MKAVQILLVDDNEGDILLTTEAFETAGIRTKLSYVKNGMDAIEYVTRFGRYSDAETPDLILLDINLPKKNGVEVLQFIKTRSDLKHIPVIMLTTSSSGKDISSSYENAANCFITKPVDLDGYQDVISQIENFWTTLPPKNEVQ